MKTSNLILTILFVMFFYSQSMAQPFNLDPKIKPIELMLQDDTKTDGAKGIATVSARDKNIVKGYLKIESGCVFELR